MTETERAMEAIRDGYPMEANYNHVSVENPRFAPDNGDAPRLLLTMDNIRAALVRIEALEAALRKWKCEECDGHGLWVVPHGHFPDGSENNEEVECEYCGGTGLHPIARAALAQTGETDG